MMNDACRFFHIALIFVILYERGYFSMCTKLWYQIVGSVLTCETKKLNAASPMDRSEPFRCIEIVSVFKLMK